MPPMCTTMTAAVWGPSAARRLSTSSAKDSGSQSAKRMRPPGVKDGPGGSVEGVRRNHDLAALNADSPQDDLQRAGAAVHGDGVPDLAELSERLLQRGAVRPQGQAAALQALADPGKDPGAVLLREVDRGGWDLHGIPPLAEPKVPHA